MKVLAISTSQREAFVDMTEQVNEIVKSASPTTGACLVFCPHTTAGVTINECADPAVVLDMKTALGELVADGGHWLHAEGNSPAHVKASLMGSSAIVPIREGKLALGRWQGIFLCEFDGPRTREVWVQVLS
jgi:secondary thiamine-phosphate synthase enzyme